MAEPVNNNLETQSSQNGNNHSVESANGKNRSRSRALWLFTLFLFAAGLAWLAYWYFYLQYHESTEDAYANGNFISINPVISGAVIAFYTDNTDLVKKGQLLVELDPTNYQSIYEKELATLAQVTLRVRQLYNDVQTQHANVRNQRAIVKRAQFDFNNRSKLRESNPEAVSKEDFFHAQQDYLSTQSNLQQAESKLNASLAAAGNTPPEKHPLIENQKAIIRSAYYNLRHCAIYAPETGYVAQRNVNVGEWVTPTTNLMAIIPTYPVWVDANFKETQLGKIRIGQPAVIHFDLYGSNVSYQGKVIGIASGTGSVFSLIPPQNATGNWIKIVQRLPVRISLDRETTEKFPVRLGISAEVDIDVSNQDLPMLATSPVQKPVEKTFIFDIHMGEVNQIMDRIVRDNLQSEQIENQKS
jgi:membrane fusion protein (multidrug efflux system)